MKRYKYMRVLTAIFACAFIFTTSTICTEEVTAQPELRGPAQVEEQVVQSTRDDLTNPLDIVASPKAYLNQKVVMQAKFDKFATLGLDYKSAFRSSEEYISFLIKRDDTIHDIPLSEMKLFLKRDVAEKFIELKTDDVIEIEGNVFSDALGDAWIDVNNLTIIKKAPDKNGV